MCFQDLRAKFPAASVECIDLLESFLRFDPTARITADDAVFHPFFNKIKMHGYVMQNKPPGSSRDSHDSLCTDGSEFSSLSLCLQPLDAENERVRESTTNLRRCVSDVLPFLTFYNMIMLSFLVCPRYSQFFQIQKRCHFYVLIHQFPVSAFRVYCC